MLASEARKQLIELETLDFTDKGEAFVESRFLTPLLAALGYETHKDYEVLRHGDDGAAFKLRYPPVELGAARVKHYNPDYIPTIRKRMFWIIEAKSPKRVPYPFEIKYLVQGLQYCVHPEIQANYLVVSNGSVTAVYDAHGAVFLDQDIYEPIFTFKCSEIISRWPELFELLSVDTLRKRIEVNIKAMYDKLSLSSLDRNYPGALLQRIGASQRENSKIIEKHVATLNANAAEQNSAKWRSEMARLNAKQVYALMDFPLRGGGSEAEYFIDKSLAEGQLPENILTFLISDFDQQSIFRKEQTFVAASVLFQRTDNEPFGEDCRKFFNQYKDGKLPLLNQVECALLRYMRKSAVLSVYPTLRTRINNDLQVSGEFARFVQPPTALATTFVAELADHDRTFEQLKFLPQDQLPRALDFVIKLESAGLMPTLRRSDPN